MIEVEGILAHTLCYEKHPEEINDGQPWNGN